jgi:translation initiation factor 2B subunit (eIF-2B alpha/beta/delta family)
MPPETVEDAIRRIATDRTSSASQLARLTLDTMALAVAEAEGTPPPTPLMEVARRLSEAQPAMAIVHNVANLVARLVAEGQDPRLVIDLVRSELEEARDRIVRNFLKVVPDRGTIVTLSYSDHVFEAIKAAHARTLVESVFVLESRPLLEGRALAAALAKVGVTTSIVPDDSGPSLFREASYGLVGADSVLRDATLVNKIGTHSLARAAESHHKPFYVVCETLKFDARYDVSTWPGTAGRKTNERPDLASGPDGYRDFDVTPGRLVTMFATERGSYAPDTVRTMLSSRRKG